MTRQGKLRHPGKAVLILFALLLTANPAPAAPTVEHRDYVITVDGKEAGRSQISITTQDDGMTVMAAKASVRLNRVVFNYSYDVQATEWWKDGRLVGLKVNANDNGKHTDIVGSADGNQLRIRVNALERKIRPDVWVNSFWKLADARTNNPVPVLDADNGKDFMGKLDYIGPEQTTVANQPVKCFHFRVSGGSSPVDLWFDEGQRLLRQEFVEQGHRTVVHLIRVRR